MAIVDHHLVGSEALGLDPWKGPENGGIGDALGAPFLLWSGGKAPARRTWGGATEVGSATGFPVGPVPVRGATKTDPDQMTAPRHK